MEHSYLIHHERSQADAAFSAALSRVQQQLLELPPVPPLLAAVLRAAVPAWRAGFCYALTYWPGEVRVTLRFGAAELDSRADVREHDDIQAIAARLLAGLLGLPLETSAETPPPPLAVVLPPVPEQQPAPLDPAPAPLDPAPAPLDPAPAGDDRPLSAEEIEAAVGMIRCMDPAVRKAFSPAFRSTFGVPADAKAITPHITHHSHLLFIDRFTVEAAGGIVAA